MRRREFDRLEQRVDQMDLTGTRGVGVLAERVTDLAKDVAKLEALIESHERQHELDRQERQAGRRWLVGTIAAMSSGILVLIIEQIAAHVH